MAEANTNKDNKEAEVQSEYSIDISSLDKWLYIGELHKKFEDKNHNNIQIVSGLNFHQDFIDYFNKYIQDNNISIPDTVRTNTGLHFWRDEKSNQDLLEILDNVDPNESGRKKNHFWNNNQSQNELKKYLEDTAKQIVDSYFSKERNINFDELDQVIMSFGNKLQNIQDLCDTYINNNSSRCDVIGKIREISQQFEKDISQYLSESDSNASNTINSHIETLNELTDSADTVARDSHAEDTISESLDLILENFKELNSVVKKVNAYISQFVDKNEVQENVKSVVEYINSNLDCLENKPDSETAYHTVCNLKENIDYLTKLNIAYNCFSGIHWIYGTLRRETTNLIKNQFIDSYRSREL